MLQLPHPETKNTFYNFSYSFQEEKIFFIIFSIAAGFNVAASTSRNKKLFINFPTPSREEKYFL